jgi:hypothetical protein
MADAFTHAYRAGRRDASSTTSLPWRVLPRSGFRSASRRYTPQDAPRSVCPGLAEPCDPAPYLTSPDRPRGKARRAPGSKVGRHGRALSCAPDHPCNAGSGSLHPVVSTGKSGLGSPRSDRRSSGWWTSVL